MRLADIRRCIGHANERGATHAHCLHPWAVNPIATDEQSWVWVQGGVDCVHVLSTNEGMCVALRVCRQARW